MKHLFTLVLLLIPVSGMTKAGPVSEQILPILRGLESFHVEGQGQNAMLTARWQPAHFPTSLKVFIPQNPTPRKQIEFTIESRSAAMFLQIRSLVDEVSQEVSENGFPSVHPSVLPTSRHTTDGFKGSMKVRVPNTPAGRNFSAAFLKEFKEISDSF